MAELDRLVSFIRSNIRLKDARLSPAYFYQSLPLCVLDAVFSIGVHYTAVQKMVQRYCAYFGFRLFRPYETSFPEAKEQQSVGDFCDRIEHVGVRDFAANVLQNHQRTSTRNGILKAEAALQFAEVLRSFSIDIFQDLESHPDGGQLETAVRSIRGQGSGLSFGYFLMLAGNDQFVKPDRMVKRFLTNALERPVAQDREAARFVETAAHQLHADFPRLTPRVLDHAIWSFQRADKTLRSKHSPR